MVSVGLSNGCVVAIGGVVDVLSVSMRVWVGVVHIPVGIVGEQKTVPGS